MSKFERVPAVIARTGEYYYQLRSEGIVTIGGRNKQALARWARSHGFSVTFVGERAKEMRTGPFDTLYGEVQS